MTNSGQLENLDGLALGYDDNYLDTPHDPPVDMSVWSGGGGLYSTVEDLFRWDQALYTDALIPQSALDRMFSVQNPKETYGYGWFISESGGHPFVGHTGGMPGVSTEIERYVDDNAVIIVLMNEGDLDAPSIAGYLRDKLFEP